jgi:predicted dehydrogenase
MNKLRWGILGAAGIARKNWRAIFNSQNGIVTAVAARDRARAEQFVRDCQAQAAFAPAPAIGNDYDEVIHSPEVDAVYIPLPTGLRKEWVIRAAQAGKHVLAEKPCALNAADLREMLAACAKHKVQYMDGVMFMHSPRQTAVREVLQDAQRIGPIRRVMSVFTFLGNQDFPANIRVNRALEPAGCLGDLGWYCLRYSLFAMNWELPGLAAGRILSTAGDGETPTQFSGELLFDGGASAGFYCAFVTEFQQWVSVMGERGTVRLADFVHPRNTYEPAYEINAAEHRVRAGAGTSIPLAPGALAEPGHETAQDTLMFKNFAAQVESGKLNADWPEIALKTQLVLDACLASARANSRLTPVSPL